ncbi:TPA: hypothetical protein QHF22_001672 [Legionella pneumophila]|uniref:Uncharacterized protein n=5 Tax=Legionellaceae TaxID=444 RepID=Q5ZTT9_LEGPH|nr:hypothetical protein lpg2072 [Legionella pneumophila subsp. pneumophila str. Philadelphia 1]AEW52262.1 hypothetical protein lp12_2013 [Legionella pneumophila subsp. pneumophila ATCC 43290]AGH53127.1 hypothetical protein LPE509_01036 [Legionella pneumophila subsp. pneumophila LPE509]AGN14991.1 hypothetical protein LP6_2096 [Legionella pneumophila subsp. pneumophila str. Thunder Bay]ANH13419.1 hypothetical protein A5478_10385 [Legionella pneumophila]APF06727.1 hypothetical protein BIZ51_10260
MHQPDIQHNRKRGYIMARITVTLPDNLHKQIIKIAGKENDSLSYTTTRLVEIGLMVMNSKSDNKDEQKTTNIEEYCQKLIIQINGIIKEIAVDKFNFDDDKIVQITKDTLNKFNKLKGIQQESL